MEKQLSKELAKELATEWLADNLFKQSELNFNQEVVSLIEQAKQLERDNMKALIEAIFTNKWTQNNIDIPFEFISDKIPYEEGSSVGYRVKKTTDELIDMFLEGKLKRKEFATYNR